MYNANLLEIILKLQLRTTKTEKQVGHSTRQMHKDCANSLRALQLPVSSHNEAIQQNAEKISIQ